MEIKGKICAVTGAGRGLGRKIAVHLATKGANVYVCDVNETSLRNFRDEVDKEHLNIRFSVCDVSNENSVVGFFNNIAEGEKRLDILINNAGITRDGLLINIKKDAVFRMPLSDFQDVVNVNLVGVFLCSREAALIMAHNDGGVIINISSISRAGNFGQTNYSASKAGVDAMTVTWSKELAKHRIRVAAIAPGFINTEMVAAIKKEVLDKITNQVPLKRLGEMAEIAGTVQFIIENDYINGRTLEIDGGLRI